MRIFFIMVGSLAFLNCAGPQKVQVGSACELARDSAACQGQVRQVVGPPTTALESTESVAAPQAAPGEIYDNSAAAKRRADQAIAPAPAPQTGDDSQPFEPFYDPLHAH